jgi:hypothetical protein
MNLGKIIKPPTRSNIFGFFLILQLVIAMGCATPEMYNSWKGAHISELVEEWGKPQKKVRLEKGNVLLIYNEIPGETRVNYLDNYSPPTKLVGFYANKNGIIYNWKEKPLGKSLFKK